MTNKVIILILMDRGAVTRRTSIFQGLPQVSVGFNRLAKPLWLAFLVKKHVNIMYYYFDKICPNLNLMTLFPAVQRHLEDRWPLTKKVHNDDVS